MKNKIKQAALEEIAKEISLCRTCKKDKVGLPVPGEGSPDAKIVFIGEAPGKKESQTGRPFIGPAGKILRSLIAASGLKDSDVFIASPVKYLPKHITPTKAEIIHGRKHLLDQLNIIKPIIIVLMGRVACLAILEKDCSIAKDHGKIIRSEGVNYFLSYHPAAPLHNPPLRKILAADFKKLKRLIGKL
ncbi:MAG TPA: uracil-DNA glycosylase [Candidatus Binatia bacterium]|nr:uracil-DNA glycosylase [Candidatus Binatia bacterium]